MALQIYQYRRLGTLEDIPAGESRQVLTVVANSKPEADAIIAREVYLSRLSDTWVEIEHTGSENAYSVKPEADADVSKGTSYEASVPGVVSLLEISAAV